MASKHTELNYGNSLTFINKKIRFCKTEYCTLSMEIVIFTMSRELGGPLLIRSRNERGREISDSEEQKNMFSNTINADQGEGGQ